MSSSLCFGFLAFVLVIINITFAAQDFHHRSDRSKVNELVRQLSSDGVEVLLPSAAGAVVAVDSVKNSSNRNRSKKDTSTDNSSISSTSGGSNIFSTSGGSITPDIFTQKALDPGQRKVNKDLLRQPLNTRNKPDAGPLKRDYSTDLAKFAGVLNLIESSKIRFSIPFKSMVDLGFTFPYALEITPADLSMMPPGYCFDCDKAETGNYGEKPSPFKYVMVEIDVRMVMLMCPETEKHDKGEPKLFGNCAEIIDTYKSYLIDYQTRGQKIAVPKPRLEKAPFLEDARNPVHSTCVLWGYATKCTIKTISADNLYTPHLDQTTIRGLSTFFSLGSSHVMTTGGPTPLNTITTTTAVVGSSGTAAPVPVPTSQCVPITKFSVVTIVTTIGRSEESRTPSCTIITTTFIVGQSGIATPASMPNAGCITSITTNVVTVVTTTFVVGDSGTAVPISGSDTHCATATNEAATKPTMVTTTTFTVVPPECKPRTITSFVAVQPTAASDPTCSLTTIYTVITEIPAVVTTVATETKTATVTGIVESHQDRFSRTVKLHTTSWFQTTITSLVMETMTHGVGGECIPASQQASIRSAESSLSQLQASLSTMMSSWKSKQGAGGAVITHTEVVTLSAEKIYETTTVLLLTGRSAPRTARWAGG